MHSTAVALQGGLYEMPPTQLSRSRQSLVLQQGTTAGSLKR